MRVVNNLTRRESGIALLTTILLMLLMSSLLVGFILLITAGQKISGVNNDYSKAFYAAEAGMEKLTADIGTLFAQNYSPTGPQVDALQNAPPVMSGINYVKFDGSNGYTISFPTDSKGNPLSTVNQIKSGPYQGMTALATLYTLNVTARTIAGSEVKLQRTTQTVGIPMFQFGVFCGGDCSFFPGPNFNFGGRTHTNGNLFLAAGSSLVLSDRVTAVKDVIRTNLSNGFPTTTGQYGGSVNVFNGGGKRALAYTEGSLTGTLGSPPNPMWPTISLGASYYAGNLRNGLTGAKTLNLAIVTLGAGTTQPIDVIRRPVVNESSLVTAERYFAQASVKILLSDNPQDIMRLPCVDTTTQPIDLSQLATPTAGWTAAGGTPAALFALMNANNAAGFNTPPLPLAASGGRATVANYSNAFPDLNGYWVPGPLVAGGTGAPIIKGFLKIEIQTNYTGIPCGAWRDVTLEVLAYGYAGRNLNPYGALNGPTTTAYGVNVTPGFSAGGTNPPLLALPAVQLVANPLGCQDPHPNAIIRLERVRDNPSTWTTANPCGVTNNAAPASQANPAFPTDYWPNVLFDPREGTLRDGTLPGGIGGINYSSMVSLNGLMQYIEVDATNLAKWLNGALPGSGNLAYDANTAPNDYSVYISDRRGNFTSAAFPTAWPPLSPSGNETGEYGFQDFVNPADQYGCPNGVLDSGEDLDGLGNSVFFKYGQDATHATQPYIPGLNGGNGYFSVGASSSATVAAALVGTATSNALTPHPNCNVAAPTSIWPFNYVIHANEGRENPNFFFRRGVKVVDGAALANNLNTCPGSVICGLTVASENPVYIQGDYNCFGCAGGTWSSLHAATSVAGDAITLLSNNWNDVNSFISPYNINGRLAVTTYYRTAVLGGKGVSFPQPTGYASPQDFGTDGGIHNFLRYIENWGGQTLYYEGSLISLYYNRQATGTFKCCTTVYSPPTRGYNFDVEFLQPTLLPPRTPLFRDVNTTGFTQLLLPTQ